MNSLCVSCRDPILNSFTTAFLAGLGALGLYNNLAAGFSLTQSKPKIPSMRRSEPIITYPDELAVVPVPPKNQALEVVPTVIATPLELLCTKVAQAIALKTGIPPVLTTPVCIATAKALYKAGKNVDYNSLMAKVKNKFLRTTNAPKGIRARLGNTTQPVPRNIAASGTSLAPVSVAHRIVARSKPVIKNINGVTTITHSEMIGSITSGTPSSNVTPFTCLGYRCNPGVATLYPWLSTMATNFEKYKFRKLSFSAVSLLSTAYNGRLGVGFDYDSSDPVPQDRQEFYALTEHSESMPWDSVAMQVKCDNVYRFTGTHSSSDYKLIDLGQLVVYTDQISNGATLSAAVNVADLYVHYECELIEPQQALFNTQGFSGTATPTVGNTLGLSPDQTTVVGPALVSGKWTSATVLTFTIPYGTYYVSANTGWSSGTCTNYAFAIASGGTVSAAAPKVGISFGATYGCVKVTAATANLTITVAGTAWNANMSQYNFHFSRIAPVIYNSTAPWA